MDKVKLNDEKANTDLKRIDQPSLEGKFIWNTFGVTHLPFIRRWDKVQYACAAMAQSTVLEKYLSGIDPKLYDFWNVPAYYMTDTEATLLNHINNFHSNSYYGLREFSPADDFLVEYNDLAKFHAFLSTCYSKIHFSSTEADKCGLIRIDNDTVVPFVRVETERYVPICYFDGDMDNLKNNSKSLDDSDLNYIQFCFKILSIKDQRIPAIMRSVVPLKMVMSLFPERTPFVDYFPNIQDPELPVGDNRLIISKRWLKFPACKYEDAFVDSSSLVVPPLNAEDSSSLVPPSNAEQMQVAPIGLQSDQFKMDQMESEMDTSMQRLSI